MPNTDLPLNHIRQKYQQHIKIHGLVEFPDAKAKALEITIIVAVMLSVWTTLWVFEQLRRLPYLPWKLVLISSSFFVGITLYIYIVLTNRAEWYWRAYRAEQAFEDPRRPVVYLRAFDADIIPEKPVTDDSLEVRPIDILGRFHKWLTGSANPMRRYSVEEDIAPYFRRVGPFVSIGRPMEFVQNPGTTRIYVKDYYWQDFVLELLGVAEFVVVRVDISPGLEWEIEQVFARMPYERIVLLLADEYGRPYGEGKYEYMLSVLPREVRVLLPHTLGNVWYIYFEPDSTPYAIFRGNGVSGIRGATAILVREVSSHLTIPSRNNNMAPDEDMDLLAIWRLLSSFSGASL